MLREVKTNYGIVRGLPAADPRITSFKGIPFAAPPVGKNRWRAPQPCPSWEGVKECYKFAPISVQNRPGLGTDIYCKEWHVDAGVEISEDNLYLNIWTPAKSPDEKLPVLVWFFGGAFQWGYTSEMEFDGERLARRGIIVVSVNYRLNLFGFLAHPEITKESPDAPCNFGLLDQAAGIKWVYENIAAFGGDKEKITIAGQSAGGGSVLNQICAERNKGIVKGAVIMSGVFPSKRSIPGIGHPMNLQEAEKVGEEFFASAKIKNLEVARSLDAEYLLAKYDEYVSNHMRMFPIQDGFFSKGAPIETIKANKCLDIPLMAGNTVDEFKDFNPIAPEVNGIEIAVKDMFETRAANGNTKNCYYYRFNPDIPGEDNPGTFHSCDLWFFFETLAKCWRPYEGHHYNLSRQMCTYWANFIKTGNPNGKDADGTDLPEWKPYDNKTRWEMEFNKNGSIPQQEKDFALVDKIKKELV